MSLSSTRRGFTYCKVCPVFSGDSCVKEKKKKSCRCAFFGCAWQLKMVQFGHMTNIFFMYSPTGAFFFNSYIFIFLCNHQMFWVFFVFLHSKYRKTATHFQIRVTKLNERRCDVWRSWVTQHLGFIHRHLNRQDAVIYGSQVASEDERGFLNAVRPCSAPIWVTCRPPQGHLCHSLIQVVSGLPFCLYDIITCVPVSGYRLKTGYDHQFTADRVKAKIWRLGLNFAFDQPELCVSFCKEYF